MLTHTELKKGAAITIDGQPCEVLEAFPQRYAQRQLIIQTKLRNLITGNILNKTVHQGESFEEAEIEKIDVKFLYNHRGKFCFCEIENPGKRFELMEEQIGNEVKFLKPGLLLSGFAFHGNIINVSLPIKVQLKVAEAPPGVKGDRAQGGTKTVKLETGANINVPLFIEQDDIIEINTDTEEYVRRVEKG